MCASSLFPRLHHVYCFQHNTCNISVFWKSSSELNSTYTELQSRKLHNKQILHATVLDIKVDYYPRNAIFHGAAINLISNTVKVQYLFYYIWIQNRVRALKTLSYQRTVYSLHTHSRTMTLLASKRLASHYDVRLAACCELLLGRHKRLVGTFTLEQQKPVDI